MACLFDEDQLVFLCGWHMVIQVAEKLRRISVREIVIGSHEQSTGMFDLFSLRKVAVISSGSTCIYLSFTSR